MQTLITYGIFETDIGKLIIGESANGLCWLGWMTKGRKGDGLSRMKEHFPGAVLQQDDKRLKPAMNVILQAWQDDDLSSLKLDIQGTDFQKSVWNALLEIPKGSTCSYGDIASAIGKPGASRAVGTAVGDNPISLLIPCHRVVQASGKLGNYGWGADIKENLLKLEAQNITHGVEAA